MTDSSALSWHRACPVCLYDRPASLYLNRMAAVDNLNLSYLVCRCAECGFHYAADLAEPAVYEAYYRSLSKYDVPRMGDFPSPLERSRANAALALCRPHLSADAEIADIGCGRGALLHVFHEAGYRRVYGLDPAPASAASLGIGSVLQGTLGDASQKLPLDRLDLICLTGVLEHLPELHRDMAHLTSSLAPHTHILIEVPALERFVRARMEPFGEFSLEHVQYFSRHSLVDLMARFGYVPLSIQIVALEGASDSLFGVFAPGSATPQVATDNKMSADILNTYIEASRNSLVTALKPLVENPRDFALYGAGSHSARLLAVLDALGLLGHIRSVVDGNPNLHGKRLGSFSVQPPTVLESEPALPVLVSSFNAQDAIARMLLEKHPQRPLILLYPTDGCS